MPSQPHKHEVLFEGLRDDEILLLPRQIVEQLILLGEPIVFRAGSATILGSFKICSGNRARSDRGGWRGGTHVAGFLSDAVCKVARARRS